MFSEILKAVNLDNTICGESALSGSRENRAAWILAGGRSSRLGTDKALLEIDGRAMAAQVAERVSKVCETVAIVGDPDRYSCLGLSVVPDSYPGQGPLAGIEAGLGATTADLNLIVACDMPALDAGILEELFAVGADCAIPQYSDGKSEPLCAVYRRRCHAPIRDALESGVRRVIDAHRLLEAQGFAIRYVRVDQTDAFANLNTQVDVARYRQRKSNG